MFDSNAPYYTPIACAIAVIVFGIYLLVRAWRKTKPGLSRLNECGPSCLLVALGLLIAGGFLTGPSPSWRSYYLNSFLNARPEDVAGITIAPHPKLRFSRLVQSEVVVTDAESIRAICSALNDVVPYSQSRSPDATWDCELRLRLPTGTYSCYVSQSGVITFVSDRGFYGLGTNFGSFRSASLAHILESLTQ